jgi:hypothetical protein
MGIEQLIAPTGIGSFILFLLSAINGTTKLCLLRYHAVTSYACLIILIVHVAGAVKCDIYEPLGMLAALGMLLTIISGRFRWNLRLHIGFAASTLALTAAHVALIIYLR